MKKLKNFIALSLLSLAVCSRSDAAKQTEQAQQDILVNPVCDFVNNRPPELAALIFSFLDPQDFAKAKRVCSSWNEFLNLHGEYCFYSIASKLSNEQCLQLLGQIERCGNYTSPLLVRFVRVLVARIGNFTADDVIRILNFLRQLMEHGHQVFPEATIATVANVNHTDNEVQEAVLTLFNVLFRYGQAFQQTSDAVVANFDHTDEAVRNGVRKLLKLLVKQIQNCPEAFRNHIIVQILTSAEADLNHTDVKVRSKAMYLLEALVKQIQNCPEELRNNIILQAITTAETNYNHPEILIREAALDIFETLVWHIQNYLPALKDRIITQAFAAAQANINHGHWHIRYEALWLCIVLAIHGPEALSVQIIAQANDVALQAGVVLNHTDGTEILQAALKFTMVLVGHLQNCPEALRNKTITKVAVEAQAYVDHEDLLIRRVAETLSYEVSQLQ